MKSKVFFLSLLLVPSLFFVQHYAHGQIQIPTAGGVDSNNYSAFGTTVNSSVNCTTSGTTVYCPLAPLSALDAEGINTSGPGAFGQYINDIYSVAITVAAVLAVIMITLGGIEYMGSESFSSKEDGKKKIWNALTGLILLLSCYLILRTINPQLLNLDISISGTGGLITPQGGSGGSGGTVGGAGLAGAAATTAASQSVLQNMVTSSNATLANDQATLQQMQATNPNNPNITVMQNKVASDQMIAANTQENFNLLYGNSQSSSQAGGTTITPTLTAYSPQSSNANGNLAMEGGLSTYSPGPDGKTNVQTLDDYVNGNSSYVTVAGDKSEIGQSFIIPSITYTNASGVTQTLKNVPVVVTDTGSAFNGAGTSHFDIPVGVNYTTQQLNKQPFSGQTGTFTSPTASTNVTGTITDENENYLSIAQDNLNADQTALAQAQTSSSADTNSFDVATLTAKVASDQTVVSTLQGNSQLATADASVIQDQINLTTAQSTGASADTVSAFEAQLASDDATDASVQGTQLLNFDTNLAQENQSAITAMQGINPSDTTLASLADDQTAYQEQEASADETAQEAIDEADADEEDVGDSGGDSTNLYDDSDDSYGDTSADDSDDSSNYTSDGSDYYTGDDSSDDWSD